MKWLASVGSVLLSLGTSIPWIRDHPEWNAGFRLQADFRNRKNRAVLEPGGLNVERVPALPDGEWCLIWSPFVAQTRLVSSVPSPCLVPRRQGDRGRSSSHPWSSSAGESHAWTLHLELRRPVRSCGHSQPKCGPSWRSARAESELADTYLRTRLALGVEEPLCHGKVPKGEEAGFCLSAVTSA